jgi:hypothetical protein
MYGVLELFSFPSSLVGCANLSLRRDRSQIYVEGKARRLNNNNFEYERWQNSIMFGKIL